MAAAETRAAWQRTANRCFVQEDAKRAPKLAYCQSSSTSSKQADSANHVNSVDSFIPNANVFGTCTGIPSGSNLSQETRWWLLMHPNFEVHKGFLLPEYRRIHHPSLEEGARREEHARLSWWRGAGGDELVTQKPLDHPGNCDLPRPQRTHCRMRNHVSGCGRALERQQNSPHPVTRKAGRECELSKNELLEALCHSQTRAREAENAVEQARAEKEDLVKLVFKQASYIFAYKQWFELLQVETLHLRLKNRSSSSGHARRNKAAAPQPLHGGFSGYTLVFALGLSLVGAGLLLGWGVGWMLLPF